MARRRKSQLTKQLVIVGSVLIAFQVAYIFLIPRAKVITIKEAIQAQLDRQTLDEKRKEQLRIQLSLEDYMRENGSPPSKLEELVPKYFDEIPKIPETKKPFQYFVKDGKTYVGDETTIAKVKGIIPAAPSGQQGVFPGLDAEAPLPPGVQQALINSLKDEPGVQAVAYTYDPTGKRDPFRPFDFAPKHQPDESKTPLEQYDISQLKLTAVLGSEGNASATVENAAGKGFIVKKGTKIGTNNGEVVEVRPDGLVVVETSTDFTGQQKTKTIEMKLRTKDQESARKGLSK